MDFANFFANYGLILLLAALLVFMFWSSRRRLQKQKAEQEERARQTVPGAEVLLQGGLYGTIVSYDLNYRPSLWKSQGGLEGARKINRHIAKSVDVMIGNEEDYTACLGFEVEGLDEHISAIDPANFKKMIQTAVKEFPNFKVAATTLRNAKTASINDWSAILYAGGEFYASMMREN